MNQIFGLLLMLSVILSCSPVAIATEKITEEYVVKALSGDKKEVIAKKAPGFAFGVAFSPHDAATGKSTDGTDGGKTKNEEFYGKLVPLGRALESELLVGYRFLIAVTAVAHIPAGHAEFSALQVAKEIKRFLTTSFAIAGERLSIEGTADHPLMSTQGVEAPGIRRWKVEIGRLE